MQESTCIICLESCSCQLKCAGCTAVYHTECIKEMIRVSPCYTKCPQCRSELPTILKSFIYARENDTPYDEVDAFWEYIAGIIMLTCGNAFHMLDEN